MHLPYLSRELSCPMHMNWNCFVFVCCCRRERDMLFMTARTDVKGPLDDDRVQHQSRAVRKPQVRN